MLDLDKNLTATQIQNIVDTSERHFHEFLSFIEDKIALYEHKSDGSEDLAMGYCIVLEYMRDQEKAISSIILKLESLEELIADSERIKEFIASLKA